MAATSALHPPPRQEFALRKAPLVDACAAGRRIHTPSTLGAAHARRPRTTAACQRQPAERRRTSLPPPFHLVLLLALVARARRQLRRSRGTWLCPSTAAAAAASKLSSSPSLPRQPAVAVSFSWKKSGRRCGPRRHDLQRMRRTRWEGGRRHFRCAAALRSQPARQPPCWQRPAPAPPLQLGRRHLRLLPLVQPPAAQVPVAVEEPPRPCWKRRRMRMRCTSGFQERQSEGKPRRRERRAQATG